MNPSYLVIAVIKYTPVIGKTYTLFGDGESTREFFNTVSTLTDTILNHFFWTPSEFLAYIQLKSKKRIKLDPDWLKTSNPKFYDLIEILHKGLSVFTPGVEDHLKSVPVYKFVTDRGLLTNRIQYYLFLMEFELVNRLNKEDFMTSNYKIALLPYCLRETQSHCKAETDAVDYVCKGCRKNCYINTVSSHLRKQNILPYIWRQSRLKTLFKELIKKHGSLGVMGIACIVELVMGMRLCMKSRIPVIGIPLNANRCIRWTDGFYENSIDMAQLESLLIHSS